MGDVHDEQGGGAASAQATPGEPTAQARPSDPVTQTQPSEQEMRAAYEAELNRISSSEMILQTAVSLLNIGGRRLGLASPAAAGAKSAPAEGQRDLEQVRDAIDGASALMPILERRMPGELGPLRDAIAQLQVAYAREAQGTASASSATAPASASPDTSQAPQSPEAAKGEAPETPKSKPPEGPGPAQASGRLWVPGR